SRLQQHGAGRGIDLVVDEADVAFLDQFSSLRIGVHLKGCRGLVVLDLVDKNLRYIKTHVDRLNLRDHHHRAAGGAAGGGRGAARRSLARTRADEIAEIDQQGAGPSGNRCDDVTIGKIELRGLDVGLIERDCALVLLNDVDLILGLLLGDRVLLRQNLITREIDLRLRQYALVVRQLRLLDVKSCLIGTRVDEEQLLTLLHILTRRELNLDDRSIDLRLHRDVIDRLDRADSVDDLRHILTLRQCGGHGDRRWRAGDGRRAVEIAQCGDNDRNQYYGGNRISDEAPRTQCPE